MSHNKHVKVVVRTRPTTQFASQAIEINQDKNIINVKLPRSEDAGFINNHNQLWSFKLDKVLHYVSQDAVFEECAHPIVRSVMDGYNGTLLAYGQTGAGKTFTMTGTTESYHHRGIIPRAISQVFREVHDRPQYAFTVRISYLEIYNEQMVDLLIPGAQAGDMNVIEDKNGCSVKGLSQHIATCEEDALNLLFEGETNRSIGDHALNRTSSRSHCIFTIHIESKSRIDSSDDVIFSKLNLVDLAGSERLAKTNSTGRTLKEAMFINKSLTFLEQVIIALADKKRDHVPFRQSRLTNVLRDSLGGNCNTLMVANIWGEAAHLEETISTLRFATRMMCVTNDPVVNVQYDPMTVIKKQEREIRELRQELAMHDTLIGRSHVQYEPFTESQKSELAKRLKAWLDGNDDEVEIVTLRQVKEIMNAFKGLYHKAQQDLLERGPTAAASDSGGGGSISRGHANAPTTAATDRGDAHGAIGEEEDGVGDTEGTGFGVGVAPSAGGQGKKKVIGNKKGNVSGKPATGTGGPFSGLNQRQPSVASALGNTSLVSPSTINIVNANAGNSNASTGANGESPNEESKEAGGPGAGAISAGFNSIDDPSRASNNVGGLGARNMAGADYTNANGVTGSLGGLSPLPPIPSKGGIKPSRNDAFEMYKKGTGKELATALVDNKSVLRDKKKKYSDLVARQSDLKSRIDALKQSIAQDRDRALQSDTMHDPQLVTIPISDETRAKIEQVRTLKVECKSTTDQVNSVRSELDYAARVVDTCRERLVREFDVWFDNVFGGPDTPTAMVPVSVAVAAASVPRKPGSASAAAAGMPMVPLVDMDTLDPSEHMDQLHQERMKGEDPASHAYYAALRKNVRKVKYASGASVGGAVGGSLAHRGVGVRV